MRISDWSSDVCSSDLVGDRDRLADIALDALIDLEHLGEFGRLVDLPVLLRRQTDARAVGAAAFVRSAEGGSGRPGGFHALHHRHARIGAALLQSGDLFAPDRRFISLGPLLSPALLTSIEHIQAW